MPLTKIAAENFTVFEDIKIPFCEGLNVLVGENGVGKTHIMKLAYAACQASKHDVSFPHHFHQLIHLILHKKESLYLQIL